MSSSQHTYLQMRGMNPHNLRIIWYIAYSTLHTSLDTEYELYYGVQDDATCTAFKFHLMQLAPLWYHTVVGNVTRLLVCLLTSTSLTQQT